MTAGTSNYAPPVSIRESATCLEDDKTTTILLSLNVLNHSLMVFLRLRSELLVQHWSVFHLPSCMQ
jgi:hypothetical protein